MVEAAGVESEATVRPARASTMCEHATRRRRRESNHLEQPFSTSTCPILRDKRSEWFPPNPRSLALSGSLSGSVDPVRSALPSSILRRYCSASGADSRRRGLRTSSALAFRHRSRDTTVSIANSHGRIRCVPHVLTMFVRSAATRIRRSSHCAGDTLHIVCVRASAMPR